MQQRISIKKTLNRLGFFTPITAYFCLFVLGSALCFSWLKKQPKLPNTPFHDIFILLLKITLYVSSTFLVLAFCSVLTSWLYFIYKKKKQAISFHVKTRPFDTPYQPIEIKISPILRPILGYIKLRFEYEDGAFSDKIQLVEDVHTNWFNKHLNGFYDWKIEEIREFRISSVIVYFEDFLQFISLTTELKSAERFYTPPQKQVVDNITALPRNTESRMFRIDKMRQVKGDLFNYKKFEAHDDVRRIVWKIYAKNRNLVIRSPEVLEPYASHLYLYVSFYSQYFSQHTEMVNKPFLNAYKNKVWSIYKHIATTYKDVRWVTDQPEKTVSFDHIPIKEEEIKHLIALSEWQEKNDVSSFVQTKNAAIVVVTSLTNAAQVAQLAQEHGREITFIFIPLSSIVGTQNVSGWLRWIFYQQEKDNTARYKSLWAVSSLRRELQKNEKKLIKILNNLS